jgi:hypothetical protein
MKRWNVFLESLATRGGTIAALLFINISIVFLMLYLVHRGEDKSAFAVAMTQVFGNFTGALLLALKGGDKPPSPEVQPKDVEKV